MAKKNKAKRTISAIKGSNSKKNSEEPILEAEHHTSKSIKQRILPYLLLSLIPFMLYGSSIAFEYVLDDKIVLSENSFVKQGIDGISDIFTKESFTGFLGSQKDLVVGGRYRPLSIAMFALEFEFFGLNPKASHFINILLYALTGLLFYSILKNLWNRGNEKWYFSIPFIAALLFILHPVHTEVVANIKSRDEILSLLFCLLALHFMYRFVRYNKKSNLVLSGISFLLALFAKENAITFIAVIPLTLFVFQNLSLKRIVIVTLPLIAAAILFIYIRYEVVGYLLDSGKEITGLMNDPFIGATIPDKFATIVYTLGYYLKLLLYPHPLTHDYYPYHIPIMNWGQWQVLFSLLLYLGGIGFAILKIKRKSVTAWGILVFVVTLSIVSNLLFPIGTFMNERFLYMPSIAFAVLMAYWLVEKMPYLLPKPKKLLRALSYGILIVLIAGYSLKTIDRVPAWRSPLALNVAASTVSVNSARANQYMAYSLYLESNSIQDRAEKQKLLNEATQFVDKALRIYPEYPDANNCKAGIVAGFYQLDGNLDTLLDAFYKIQIRQPSPFVDIYLDYLANRTDKSRLNNFYRKLGTDLVLKGNRVKGEFYLRKIN